MEPRVATTLEPAGMVSPIPSQEALLRMQAAAAVVRILVVTVRLQRAGQVVVALAQKVAMEPTALTTRVAAAAVVIMEDIPAATAARAL
ncbi:hypothetical protein D4Q85_00345 [bacterium]|nr:MAG: hypothetical protein D4Q85_00345 [bacterium]